jgi:hypothetical protein
MYCDCYMLLVFQLYLAFISLLIVQIALANDFFAINLSALESVMNCWLVNDLLLLITMKKFISAAKFKRISDILCLIHVSHNV